jgi:hypothetical protein
MALQFLRLHTRVFPSYQILGVLHKGHALLEVVAMLPIVQLDPCAILLLVAVPVTQTAWAAFWQVSTHLNAPPLGNVLRALPTPPSLRAPVVQVPWMVFGALGQACVIQILESHCALPLQLVLLQTVPAPLGSTSLVVHA